MIGNIKMRIVNRNKVMLDKVSMINLVWMTMVSGMLVATIALYDQKVDQQQVYGPYASAQPFLSSHY